MADAAMTPRGQTVLRILNRRKDFTHRERGRTFEAAKKMVEDVKAAAEAVSSSKSEDKKEKKDPRGKKPKHPVSREEIAEALGVSETTVGNAEQHVETAEEFPFMQGKDWVASTACFELKAFHAW